MTAHLRPIYQSALNPHLSEKPYQSPLSLSVKVIIQTFYTDVVRGTAHALYPYG